MLRDVHIASLVLVQCDNGPTLLFSESTRSSGCGCRSSRCRCGSRQRSVSNGKEGVHWSVDHTMHEVAEAQRIDGPSGTACNKDKISHVHRGFFNEKAEQELLSNPVVAAEWDRVDADYMHEHAHSMPKRCAAVIAAKGWHTKH